MKTVMIFIIQGYESTNQMGQLTDVVSIELIDTSVESALKRAKKIVKKSNYRVAQIIERLEQDANK